METVMQTQTPPGLQPLHKAAVVQFLERVYGIEDQITFFRLLENGFLPDLRAAITLEAVTVALFKFYRYSIISSLYETLSGAAIEFSCNCLACSTDHRRVTSHWRSTATSATRCCRC